MADFGDFTAAGNKLDTTIPLGAKAPAPTGFAAPMGNPFETMYRLASTQNALNANTQFQMKIVAQKALGPIYAQNIDPNTGEVDADGVLKAASQDPRIAPMLPEIAASLASTRGQVLENQSKALALHKNKLGFMINTLASSSDGGKGQSWDSDENIQHNLMLGVQQKLITPAEASNFMVGLRPPGPGRTEQVAQLKSSMLTAQERLEAEHKTLPELLTGNSIYQFQQNQTAPGSPLSLVAQGRMGLTPEQQITPHQIAQPGGGFTTYSGADLAGGRVPGQNPGSAGSGGGVSFQGQGGTQGAGPAPGPSANMPAGTTGADMLKGAQGGTGAAPAPNALGAAAPGAQVGTRSITPGQQEYQTTVNKDAAIYKASLDSRVAVGGTIMQTLGEARNALTKFNPGGGADEWAKLAQAAQAVGAPQKLVDAIGNRNLAASQEFQKLMVNTTMGQIREQLQGVGASRLSQMEFATFQQNNPNIDTDPRAIEKIFNFWTRLYQKDKAEQSQRGEYIKNGGDPVEWPGKWQDLAQQQGYINPQITNLTERTPTRQGLHNGRRVQQYSNGDIEYVK